MSLTLDEFRTEMQKYLKDEDAKAILESEIFWYDDGARALNKLINVNVDKKVLFELYNNINEKVNSKNGLDNFKMSLEESKQQLFAQTQAIYHTLYSSAIGRPKGFPYITKSRTPAHFVLRQIILYKINNMDYKDLDEIEKSLKVDAETKYMIDYLNDPLNHFSNKSKDDRDHIRNYLIAITNSTFIDDDEHWFDIIQRTKETLGIPDLNRITDVNLSQFFGHFFYEHKDEEKKSMLDRITTLEVEPQSHSEERNMKNKYTNKNIILYGVPGTGKTFNSIDYAVRIAMPDEANENHEKNVEIFRKLIFNQIEFITFHQNYNYEDFMIGIRPNTDGDVLNFEKSEGIFYKLCKKAEENYKASGGTDDDRVDFDAKLEEFLKPLTDKQKEIQINYLNSDRNFTITEILDKSLKFKKPSGDDSQYISIQTLRQLYNKSRTPSLWQKTYYQPIVNKLKELNTVKQKQLLKNYVIIIDEINRANISKVFGELITLLEDDKRLGEKHQLIITLPNGEQFGVPPNVYLIGTMNTADKSIALVDVALRRRFEFIYFPPNLEVIKEEEKKELLSQLNKNIYEKKGSADFLIGHSFFMDNSTDIQTILEKKVIPLLMEYFSGKVNKVNEIFVGTGWNCVFNPEDDKKYSYKWRIRKNG